MTLPGVVVLKKPPTKSMVIYCEAYSFLSEEVNSENTQLLKMVDIIFEHLKNRGIHAIDRGGDRGVLYKNYGERLKK
jgi:hypothetical protein